MTLLRRLPSLLLPLFAPMLGRLDAPGARKFRRAEVRRGTTSVDNPWPFRCATASSRTPLPIASR
jgi:hypothetical protein